MDTPRTFKITRMADFDHEADIAKQRAKFPGSKYGDSRSLRYGLRDEFETAIAGPNEEKIQRLLTVNPYLLQYVIPNSGHHGTWIFPKQMIRTKAINGTPGLIPDFLVATSSSLGYTWHIVELKRATVQFSKASGISYTRDAADGIAQCAKYRAHFTDYIETVRNNIGIPHAIAPDSVILVIGDATRETEAERACRREFDRLSSAMSVVSYDRIRQGLANDLRYRAEHEIK
jgi:hypothetical protein